MNELIHHLQMFDLTDNEARTYLAFLTHGAMNGYEVAKKCNISRGNIYSCLQRLVEKGALAKEDTDKYIPVPLEVFSDNYRLQLKQSQQAAVRLLKQHVTKQHDEAQVLSLSGAEAIIDRCRSIINASDSKLVLVAAFAQELNALKGEIEAAGAVSELSILSFGKMPRWLKDASEHLAEEHIEKAQGGRLLMAVAYPQALIAVIRPDGSASGIWAWNRYLASAIALYISHEILIIKMWPMLDASTQARILPLLSDLSSKIALAGVVPEIPLDTLVAGALSPRPEERQ